jgi:hypothetical protein
MKAFPGFILAAVAIILVSRAHAAPDPDLPGLGFDSGRYAGLWTKSPFAIATPDAPAASEDYELVGMAQFDGISYVTLIDKQNQDHLILASDKPLKDPRHNLDLQLVSIAHGTGGASAILLRNGESMTLQEEQASASSGAPALPQPIEIVQQQAMVPSDNPSVGGFVPASSLPPAVRFHRRLIHVPPPPQ